MKRKTRRSLPAAPTAASGPSGREALPRSSPGHARLAGVLACFFLSGFAALLYQTAWLREFSIAFGTSEIAVATVLAAYMGGLALGAAASARLVEYATRPVLVYGLLEGGIALSALAVPLLIAAASGLAVMVLGGQPAPPDAGRIGQPLFYLTTAVLVLLVPTALMGATLPLLTRYAVRSDRQLGPLTAILYSMNTLGAVLGTVLAAFQFLPALGLARTVWIGVAANVLVFGVAVWLARQERIDLSGRTPPVPGASVSARAAGSQAPWFGGNAWILPLMAVSGAIAFTYEILWTRLLNHVLGGTVYAFGTMLASFLAGIALGSALAGRLATRRRTAAASFTIAQCLIALAAAVVYAWLQSWQPRAAGLGENALVAVLVMLPATLFIGATFPLAVRILARDEGDAGPAAARVYAWNTVGAIVGATGAGFLLIPATGFEGTMKLAVALNALLATVSLLAASRHPAWLLVAIPAMLAIAFFYQPSRPVGVLDTSIVDEGTGGRELFYAVGRSSTVLLKEQDGMFLLRTNGLPEATVLPQGAPPSPHSQRWLTTLPVLARPDAADLLLIGLGGGVALERIPASVEAIDAIELEPEVLEANVRLASLRAEDPLADPRVRVILNDARGALRLTEKRYDAIVSQPSHPWTAGASHLYTREFVGLAASRLRDGGVFVQWINSQFLDERLLRQLAATLLQVFPHVEVYQPQPEELLFLASAAPIGVFDNYGRAGPGLDLLREHLADTLGVQTAGDLVVSLALDEQAVRELAAGAAPVTDDRNGMAFFSRPDGTGLTYPALMAALEPLDPLLAGRLHELPPELAVDWLDVGRGMVQRGFERRALGWIEVLQDPALRYAVRSHGLQLHGRHGEAAQAAALAHRSSPDDQRYLFLAVAPKLGALAEGKADPATAALAAQLEGPAAAVVAGWRYAHARDWLAVARLDPALAASVPADPWFFEAVKLRADWRVRVDAGVRTGELLEQAQRLIDRQLLDSANLDLLVIRAAVGLRRGDAAVVVESAAAVAAQVRRKLQGVDAGTYAMDARERQALRARVDTLERQIVRIEGVREARRAEVASSLASLRASLDAR